MKITLTGNPLSTNSIYKRNGRTIYMSKAGKAMKESYQWQAKMQWKGYKCLTEPLEIGVRLYFGDKRVHDIDNYNKLVLDSLTEIVWDDDRQIRKMTLEKLYDKENPRVEISILKK